MKSSKRILLSFLISISLLMPQGYAIVYAGNNRISIEINGHSQKIDKMNMRFTANNQIIIYTDEKYLKNNDKNSIVTIAVVAGENNNYKVVNLLDKAIDDDYSISIPEGGYLIAGIGKGAEWINNNIKSGDEVNINNVNILNMINSVQNRKADENNTTMEVIPVSSLQPSIHLEKPQLTGTGGELIFSDSPESFDTEGAFYRDTVTGQFRVFWHHQNMSQSSLTVSAAITNESSETVMLYSQGSGVATNIYPDVAGQEALYNFMETNNQEKYLATLQPGQSYLVSSLTPSAYTTSGIAQFEAYTRYGHKPATVTVTTLNYSIEPLHPENVDILQGDFYQENYVGRGTFPHFNLTGTIKYSTSVGNAYISLSSAAFGQWSDALPGEYQEGYDPVDGETVIDNGNYGIMYNLNVVVNNDMSATRQLKIYDNPAGGYGHYVMKWENNILQSGFLSYENAWKFAESVIGSNIRKFTLQTSIPGGACGPSKIFFTNIEVD
ncbi:hypothetical protein BFT35_01125 [Thermoanaerobacterium thermosaccharolyticum]|uniref:Copper amine oxidase n=1 Tax=Thermoanaerobacterium thermosaccharolyticum TaxID=1517 RepID=A0A223HVK1_THETR|nr:hypothetical protein [Thermoanaerobacterium thermosaccharolyticum]AST56520.1 copper amine oxidase [Thermoanaerobacterium thermosaccharolyticum]PHO08530.1 hypothetical protein BFT35_01125 [Thermoanaerobacterium thermosaccharolyticum]